MIVTKLKNLLRIGGPNNIVLVINNSDTNAEMVVKLLKI